MATRVKINQNRIAPAYGVNLLDGYGAPVNLTAATVRFKLQSAATGVLKVDAPATIVNAVAGTVRYDWQVGDTDTVGLYLAYWTVNFASGVILDYPSDTTDLIDVVSGPNEGYTLQGACAQWTTVQNVRACCSGVTSVTGTAGYASDQTIQDAINVSTDLLYTLSGQQFPGECRTTLRPCGPANCYGMGGNYLTQFPGAPDPSAYAPRECGCGILPKVDLALWPITNILYVKVDGAIIPASTYRLDLNRYLIRLAGASPTFTNDGWPTCQYLDRPGTAEGTFEVMVEYGMGPPPAGEDAATRLACELVKSCVGLTCQLPNRVQSVNRQQVSITMIDPSMLDNGLTGIYEVDVFLMAYNPAKTRGQTVVWSPDLRPGNWRAGR